MCVSDVPRKWDLGVDYCLIVMILRLDKVKLVDLDCIRIADPGVCIMLLRLAFERQCST